jgi:hypothetical protein
LKEERKTIAILGCNYPELVYRQISSFPVWAGGGESEERKGWGKRSACQTVLTGDFNRIDWFYPLFALLWLFLLSCLCLVCMFDCDWGNNGTGYQVFPIS